MEGEAQGKPENAAGLVTDLSRVIGGGHPHRHAIPAFVSDLLGECDGKMCRITLEIIIPQRDDSIAVTAALRCGNGGLVIGLFI